MEYQDIKNQIEDTIVELAKLIEKFCVIDNKEYTQLYKNQLKELHTTLEEIIK